MRFKRYEAIETFVAQELGCTHKHKYTHTGAREHSTNGTTLSLAVTEMTDVAAGGKTSEKYRRLFGVFV